MTFRELAAVFEGARQRDLRALEIATVTAWYGAAFERSKRLPSLQDVLKKIRPPKPMSGDDIRAYVFAMNEQMGGTVVKLSEAG